MIVAKINLMIAMTKIKTKLSRIIIINSRISIIMIKRVSTRMRKLGYFLVRFKYYEMLILFGLFRQRGALNIGIEKLDQRKWECRRRNV